MNLAHSGSRSNPVDWAALAQVQRSANPLSFSPGIVTGLKVAGGVALLGLAGALVYKAVRPTPPASPMLAAGTYGLIVQAPAGTTAQGLQTELAPVLGTVQAVPFTAIPLALKDPSAATLWSVTVTFTGTTSLAALNNLYAPVGVSFLTGTVPTLSFTANRFSGTAGTPVTVTAIVTSSGATPSIADVTAYAAAIGLSNLSGSLLSTNAAGQQTWTIVGTPTKTGAFYDFSISYGGNSQSYAMQSVV